MTLQQLEYILAVDRFRHFAKAAAYCNVTQPTLSAMIMKLEDELGIPVFDRTAHPVITTDFGRGIINQANEVLNQAKLLKEIVAEFKNEIRGELKLGVIPTISPYLLPLVLFDILSLYPDLRLIIREMQTQNIIDRLKSGELDAGIVATPLKDSGVIIRRLYLEPLGLYVSDKNAFSGKKYILPSELDPSKIWLLEEGNCLREQFINLCRLNESERKPSNLDYSVSNLETLVQLVDSGGGMTLIPQLARFQLSADKQQHVIDFEPPTPVREVSFVFFRQYAKQRINEVVIEFIRNRMEQVFSKSGSVVYNYQIIKIFE